MMLQLYACADAGAPSLGTLVRRSQSHAEKWIGPRAALISFQKSLYEDTFKKIKASISFK